MDTFNLGLMGHMCVPYSHFHAYLSYCWSSRCGDVKVWGYRTYHDINVFYHTQPQKHEESRLETSLVLKSHCG